MRTGPLACLVLALAVLTTIPTVWMVTPAEACDDGQGWLEPEFTRFGAPLGVSPLQPMSWTWIAPGFGYDPDGQTMMRLTYECTDVRAHEGPRASAQVPPGQYGVLAGVALLGTRICPGDWLLAFMSTQFGGTELVTTCLADVASAPFQARTITIPDTLERGQSRSFDLFQFPAVIAYPAAYFAVLVPPSSSAAALTSATAIAFTVCAPTVDAAGHIGIGCSP